MSCCYEPDGGAGPHPRITVGAIIERRYGSAGGPHRRDIPDRAELRTKFHKEGTETPDRAGRAVRRDTEGEDVSFPRYPFETWSPGRRTTAEPTRYNTRSSCSIVRHGRFGVRASNFDCRLRPFTVGNPEDVVICGHHACIHHRRDNEMK